MVIDTTSKCNMERDMMAFLDITLDELYQYIDFAAKKAQEETLAFQTDIFYSELNTIISDLQPVKTIDEIMCFHLSRRLNSQPDDLKIYDLKQLLLSDNELVRFLKKYSVEFQEQNNHLTLYYQDRMVPLDNTMNSDVCYLRSRFGYNPGRQDYCFNGFAMRDLLMRNYYARELYDGPEFLVKLAHYLKNGTIMKKYKEVSTYYCYTLRMPISKVILDGHDEFNNENKWLYLVDQICYRLCMYTEGDDTTLHDDDNPIILTSDNTTLPEKYKISREVITLDMLS